MFTTFTLGGDNNLINKTKLELQFPYFQLGYIEHR